MRIFTFLNLILILFNLAVLSGSASAEIRNGREAILFLQKGWEICNYQLKGDEKEKAFLKLLADANKLVQQFPSDASVLTWRGIINSTFAGVAGGLGALKYADLAKQDLENAIRIDPNVLEGGAFTSLGALYYKVPGWPISFGDDDKARLLLEKGIIINPAGIDSNYFYGDFLAEEDFYQKAKEHLIRALNAKPRPGREVADQGRRKEIRALLTEVEDHL